jgi:uncharacterized membrane-anchored protein YitT (DUF2179 family)
MKPGTFRRELSNAVFVALGVMSAGLGLKGFLLSSHFIDGGVTGVSMLLAEVLGLPLAVLIPVLNLPFVVLGWSSIGRGFAIRSTLAMAALAVVLATVHYPDITPDRLLTAVFGGFFIGAGIGLAMRGMAVLDGTEMAALLVRRRFSVLRIGDVILAMNVLIFSAAAFFLGIEQAMYSMLTYFAASRTLDFVVHGIEEYTAVLVVTPKSEEVRAALTGELGRGVTVLRGRGGVSDADQDVLYCVVTRLEIGRVKTAVRAIDPGAFLVTHPLSEAEGGVMKQRGAVH